MYSRWYSLIDRVVKLPVTKHLNGLYASTYQLITTLFPSRLSASLSPSHPPYLLNLCPELQQEPRRAKRSPLCPAVTSKSSRTVSPMKILTSATAPTSLSSSMSATSRGPLRSRWAPANHSPLHNARNNDALKSCEDLLSRLLASDVAVVLVNCECFVRP